jgi:superfamily II DNA or RNA helicase
LSGQLSLHAIIDSEIKIEPSPALDLFVKPLLKALTFENIAWKRKQERGVYTGDEPRYRHAYTKDEDGTLHLARGAWRQLAEQARQHDVHIEWDPRTIKAEDTPAEYNFGATLRPYQEAAINAAIASRGGVIVIPTGGGKTMVAFGLAAALQTSTLFIVHTRELLQQTKNAAEAILGVEVGTIGSGVWDPKPFTVALVQTLARRDLDAIKHQFGLLIVDEAHHAPSQTYCQLLPQFPARYRVALTATPYRKDGMHELLWLQFGDVVYRLDKRDLEEHGRLMSPTIHPVTTQFFYEFQDDFVTMISALCNNARRHSLVVDTIIETHRPGGCSLVLTERVEHAKALYKSLEEAGLPVVVLHGKLRPKIREASVQQLRDKEVEILVATLSLIGEGWDHPPLETLYLTVPNGNRTKTTQALGRILRPAPHKPKPRVYDFVDLNVGILRHHWSIRGRVYGLSPDAIRAALQLPPFEQPRPDPPKRNMPPIPRKQLLDALRAAGDGDFDVASSIIGQEKKDKK